MATVNVQVQGRSDTLAIYRTSVSKIFCFRFRVFDRALVMNSAAVVCPKT
jgi:hypothetical protein